MIAPLPPPPAAQVQSASLLTNPNLSATLRLEYDALVNDMRRAHDLCADFQRQLAGKSNEVDALKEIFAKTQGDLFQLQDSINELREERHRLANEAMRVTALSRKLAEVTAERDGLLAEVERSKSVTAPALRDPNEAHVKVVVSEMWQALERLQTILDSDGALGGKTWVGAPSAALSQITNPSAPADNLPS